MEYALVQQVRKNFLLSGKERKFGTRTFKKRFIVFVFLLLRLLFLFHITLQYDTLRYKQLFLHRLYKTGIVVNATGYFKLHRPLCHIRAVFYTHPEGFRKIASGWGELYRSYNHYYHELLPFAKIELFWACGF